MPIKIYKFMESQYVEGFIKQGTVKIGTAEEFRKPDGLNDGRSDCYELVSHFSPGDEREFRIGDIPILAAISPDLVDKRIRMGGTGSILYQTDMYLFCASINLTKLLVRGMRDKFNCDACVEIKDAEWFASCLTARSLQFQESQYPSLESNHYYGGPVTYARSDPAAGRINSVLQKRPEFRWQREFRFFWGGMPPRSGFLVDVPEIRSLSLAREVNLAPYL